MIIDVVNTRERGNANPPFNYRPEGANSGFRRDEDASIIRRLHRNCPYRWTYVAEIIVGSRGTNGMKYKHRARCASTAIAAASVGD